MLKYFRDRKSLGWLAGAFLLVLVIFAFVAFYIPDFMTSTGAAGTGEVAWVEGTPISAQEFQRTYRAQEQQYRQQLGPQFSPDLMRQLGFDNLVLRQLVQNQILFLEAERQGIAVTDQEVSDFIVSLATFQSAATRRRVEVIGTALPSAIRLSRRMSGWANRCHSVSSPPMPCKR